MSEKKKNAWIEHVQKYAKDNNVPYRIAIKESKATYVKKSTNVDFQPTPEDIIEHNIVAVIKTKKNKNKKE